MAWIESHETLGEHPKMYALMEKLQIKKHEAAWRDGDLSKFSRSTIATAIGWRGDPYVLFSALHHCRWLNQMRVHDWHDYSGDVVRKRLEYEAQQADRNRRISGNIPESLHPTNGAR